MRFGKGALAGSVLAIGAVALFAYSQSSGSGLPRSASNKPWPAAVKTDQPQYPPALSPEEEMKTFTMPAGYHVELVAAEPLVSDPILAEFDGNGRLWVLEMHGFANGENMDNIFAPVNDLVILEDTDGDGAFDKRTVFMDKLIMPRAFKILDKGCALIGEPPNLWKACDTDGDMKVDKKELISDTFSKQGVVEHGASGLYWSMDNTINVAEHTWNARWKSGKFEIIPSLTRGQWGVTQDDAGRVYRNINTDPLFVDYIPSRYFVRNPNLVRTRGLYESLVKQETTQIWPARPTKGVNRGYREEVTRPDGSASYYQGVSSPMFYRGTRLPKDVQGQPFVVDSPTNLVHLLSISDDGSGRLSAKDFYKKGEFLNSTDERFRPVSLAHGWDGTFYVIDMYRGVSQDGPIQTDYLRNYIKEHRLWETINLGRIYRVVRDGMSYDSKPRMLDETPAQLVEHLSHPNGWWRDTAQQLLVQRGDKTVVPALEKLATSAPDPRTRLHALWTLDGLDSSTPGPVLAALTHESPDVRLSGLRLSEHWLGAPEGGAMRAAVLKLMDDPNWQVRRQLAATLGELPEAQRVQPIMTVMQKYGDDPMVVDAAISGLRGHEAEVLAQMMAQPQQNPDTIGVLVGATSKDRDVAETQLLLAQATDERRPAAVRLAILNGLGLGLEGADGRVREFVADGRAGGALGGPRRREVSTKVQLPAEPTAVANLAKGTGDMAEAAKKVVELVNWPGKPVVSVAARTPAQNALFEQGRATYAAECAGCHQAEGRGIPRIGAALAGSKLVNVPNSSVVVRILTAGKEGSIGLMPPAGATMSDEQLAGVLTFVRGSWGNTAPPVSPEEVAEWKKMYVARKTPWTDEELLPKDK